MSQKRIKLTDLIPDDCNFNKGTDLGRELLDKSWRELGAGRSILLDKNNRIVAGNKTVEQALLSGFTKVRIIDSDGKNLIAVLRTDVDLDSPQGRKLALADNSVTQADLVWDDKKLADMAQKFGIDLSEWKMKIAKLVADKDNKVQTIINDEKELKLVFTPEQYSFVLNALRRYGDDFTLSILKVLKIDE